MSETIPACPECDSAKVETRVGSMGPNGAEHDWYCNRCLAKFDDAKRRERQTDWSTSPAELMLERAGVSDPEAAMSEASGSGGR